MSENLPDKPGVYLVHGSTGEKEIEVYEHPVKGLCCYADDFFSAGSGVDDSTDCHVSVQCTGLTFIRYLRSEM